MQAIFPRERDTCRAGFSQEESLSYRTGEGTHFSVDSLEYRVRRAHEKKSASSETDFSFDFQDLLLKPVV
jgi:hypothetical protein